MIICAIRVDIIDVVHLLIVELFPRKQIFNVFFTDEYVSLLYFFQDQEWEVVEKPGQSSSPQVSRKDETSSSSQKPKPPRPEPPSSLPSSPAKKKESPSNTPEGTRWFITVTINSPDFNSPLLVALR